MGMTCEMSNTGGKAKRSRTQHSKTYERASERVTWAFAGGVRMGFYLFPTDGFYWEGLYTTLREVSFSFAGKGDFDIYCTILNNLDIR